MVLYTWMSHFCVQKGHSSLGFPGHFFVLTLNNEEINRKCSSVLTVYDNHIYYTCIGLSVILNNIHLIFSTEVCCSPST